MVRTANKVQVPLQVEAIKMAALPDTLEPGPEKSFLGIKRKTKAKSKKNRPFHPSKSIPKSCGKRLQEWVGHSVRTPGSPCLHKHGFMKVTVLHDP